MSLKMYNTGASYTSRTIPLELGEPIKEYFTGLFDFRFIENLEIEDDVVMSVDFAILDNEWAYWCAPLKRISENSWSVEFRLCCLKTYMLRTGKTEIKGLWNKTPAWIDRDTITPAVSGYKKRRDIPLPGYIPEINGRTFVWLEMTLRVKVWRKSNFSVLEDETITVGTFVTIDRYNNDTSLMDFMSDISHFRYFVSPVEAYNIDSEQIENISFSRLCPYEFEIYNSVNYHFPKLIKRPGAYPTSTFKLIDSINGKSLIMTVLRKMAGSFTKNQAENMDTIYINSGEIIFDDNEYEQKYCTRIVFGNSLMGKIDQTQKRIPYRYTKDNTGWYLELDTQTSKIVIPSNPMPYSGDTYMNYKIREMSFDRNELARINEYAKNKMYSDIVKGLGNGALAGGFAGTNTATFGAAMGAMSFLGSTAGGYMDYRASIIDNKKAQENKELMMKDAVDSFYNAGYGYRYGESKNNFIRYLEPIDDMETLINVIGYSCTGNLTTPIMKGFLQGVPEPSDEIKGYLRDGITTECQMGVWFI